MMNQFTQAPLKPMPIAFYLKEQENTLNSLAELLKEERIALRHRELPLVNSIAEKKSELMVKLQGNDQKIRLHPESQLLKTVFKDRVDAIKSSLQDCKKLNAINGRLISLAMNSTRRLSAILMQTRDRATRNMTYNCKGSTTARGPMRLSIEC